MRKSWKNCWKKWEKLRKNWGKSDNKLKKGWRKVEEKLTKNVGKKDENIARGTTDPGYWVYNLNHFSDWNQFEIILAEKDHSSYGLNTLGPLCLWQCLILYLEEKKGMTGNRGNLWGGWLPLAAAQIYHVQHCHLSCPNLFSYFQWRVSPEVRS